MGKERDMSIVLGSGEQGVRWVNRKGPTCFAFDKEPIKLSDEDSEKFVQGDSFHLPFNDNSIGKIYSDFLLNQIQAGSSIAADVAKEPDTLSREPYPKNVRTWYNDEIKGHFQLFPHFGQVRWMLRETALAEMWRVLTVGGEINIVDHSKVVSWIINNNKMLFSNRLYDYNIFETKNMDFDFERSSSLVKVCKIGAKPRKLIIQKREFTGK